MQQMERALPNGATMPISGGDGGARLEAITGFACVIEYDGDEPRTISCRRYDSIGDKHYVGAVCATARGYRQFRCDRISSVFDINTGEILGGGEFFRRFAVDRERAVADTWGLTRSRHTHLVAGLNVLAFMANCDGQWHPLEGEIIQDFVCSLWMRKEWEGEPPLEKIVQHARSMSPDTDVFGAALKNFVRSSTSERLLRAYIARVIEADGRITDDEHRWAMHFAQIVEEYAVAQIAELPDGRSTLPRN